jgi:hypothetical protein
MMQSIFAKYDTKAQMKIKNTPIRIKATFSRKLTMSVNETK